MKNFTLPLLVAITASIASGQAAITPYTQSSSFFSALTNPAFGPSQTETYESNPTDTSVPTGGLFGGYTYTFFPDDYDDGTLSGRIDDRNQVGVYAGNYSVAGGTRSLGTFFTPTGGGAAVKSVFSIGEGFRLGVPTGTRAIGLFFNAAGAIAADDFFINIGGTIVGGDPVGGFTAANGGVLYDTMQAKNDPTNTFTLYFVGLISDTPFTSAYIGERSTGAVTYNVDNLTTATPEPTSIGLLALGLTGLVGSSRRRNAR